MTTEDIIVNGEVITLTFKDDAVGYDQWHATNEYDYYQFLLDTRGDRWVVKLAVMYNPDIIAGTKIEQAHINLVFMSADCMFNVSDKASLERYSDSHDACDPWCTAQWIANALDLKKREAVHLRLKMVDVWRERHNIPGELNEIEDA